MRFSIITPSYGQLDWLRLCIASVADQLTPESWCEGRNVISGEVKSVINPHHTASSPLALEHIIQDGGSQGIEEFAIEVGRDLKSRYGGDFVQELQIFELLHFRTESGYSLRVFKEPDFGMYDAINKGLKRASGKICAWLNSDEQYLEGTLSKVDAIFSARPGLDVLLGDALLTDEWHHPVCYRRIMVPSLWHTRLDHLHSLSCAMFFRKSSLPSPPLEPRWRVISDAVLMDYFLQLKKNVLACGQLLAVYSFTGKNLSANPTNSEHAEWMKELSWPPLWLRSVVVLFNRIRRMASGAYRNFTVDEKIFTRKSPEIRQPLHAQLSGRWPKETGFALSPAA